MKDVSRRNFVKTAAVSAVAVSTAGVLAACSSERPADAANDQATTPEQESTTKVLSPTTAPTAETGSNFNKMPDSKTAVGTTYENLMSAIEGETGATTKYAAFSKVAETEGFDQISRLFACTSDAEKIHIELEYELASKMNADTKKPEPPSVDEFATDINLILGANGEIYETSDMYPAFIEVAQEEGEDEAVKVFTRAKLAEAYHAERYLDAYNTIDTPSDDVYYLCPVCGYIHKGEDITACPICLAKKDSFVAY